MLDPNHPISKLAREDGRYRVDAYTFVFEALNHAHTAMGIGEQGASDTAPEIEPLLLADEQLGEEQHSDAEDVEGEDSFLEEAGAASPSLPSETEKHVTGQQLCIAIRSLALEQYGYMAKCVLNSWGVHKTVDFGNIVFKLIEIGQMKKTDQDRLEDFEDVFDFDRELVENFSIPPSSE